jgi:hypothetical protein
MPFPAGIEGVSLYFKECPMPNKLTQPSPASYADPEQTVLTMTIGITGQATDDLTLALGVVLRLVEDGFTAGFDHNESGSYRFSID